ncbi:hypothetical protein PsorP6_018358 [Peronosclerospora sorghi]|nr:hypothetical protein PsorP6_018354 [Peronosclerospora sorghi]KAI9895936.1 hypothetical protein PsorP6_018358 [Peronosclerospora sorghi]
MVTTYCAIVGKVGTVFPVDMDASRSVGHLKEAIAEKQKFDCAASRLQLFLAQTESGAWLTEADVLNGVNDTIGLKPLDIVGAPFIMVELSEEDVRFKVTKEPVMARKTPVHVVVAVPQQERPKTEVWIVDGVVANALHTKGVRSRLYRLAELCHGYYDPDHHMADKIQALWYEGTTLRVHVLFETKEKALDFEVAFKNEPRIAFSPLYDQVVETSVSYLFQVPNKLQRIDFDHYVPQETESPLATMSSISGNTSIVDTTTDEFKHQRLESEEVFGPLGMAQSCHLMSR